MLVDDCSVDLYHNLDNRYHQYYCRPKICVHQLVSIVSLVTKVLMLSDLDHFCALDEW